MKTQTENLFDLMVQNLMKPTEHGGSGLDEKQATAIAESALKKLKP